MKNKDLIKDFEEKLKNTKREGIEKLISFIRDSDFYTAPASTRFHSCHEGGLLEHSMNVRNCLINKKDNPTWKEILSNVDNESLEISSLLHDVCKTYFYVQEPRNKKIYSEKGSKQDIGGRYDWETVMSYTIDDKYPYGHGEKSVMMIEQFIKLKPIERYMIRWHMGFTEPKENWNAFTAAVKKYPAILALHSADLESTYLIEKEE